MAAAAPPQGAVFASREEQKHWSKALSTILRHHQGAGGIRLSEAQILSFVHDSTRHGILDHNKFVELIYQDSLRDHRRRIQVHQQVDLATGWVSFTHSATPH
jgi:hypothetical protein